jgi:hypothetical protein
LEQPHEPDREGLLEQKRLLAATHNPEEREPDAEKARTGRFVRSSFCHEGQSGSDK